MESRSPRRHHRQRQPPLRKQLSSRPTLWCRGEIGKSESTLKSQLPERPRAGRNFVAAATRRSVGTGVLAPNHQNCQRRGHHGRRPAGERGRTGRGRSPGDGGFDGRARYRHRPCDEIEACVAKNSEDSITANALLKSLKLTPMECDLADLAYSPTSPPSQNFAREIGWGGGPSTLDAVCRDWRGTRTPRT